MEDESDYVEDDGSFVETNSTEDEFRKSAPDRGDNPDVDID